MHQNKVPIRPSTLADTGIDVWGAITDGILDVEGGNDSYAHRVQRIKWHDFFISPRQLCPHATHAAARTGDSKVGLKEGVHAA